VEVLVAVRIMMVVAGSMVAVPVLIQTRPLLMPLEAFIWRVMAVSRKALLSVSSTEKWHFSTGCFPFQDRHAH